MREHRILDSVIAALVDGKFEVDNQVQENCVKCVFRDCCPMFCLTDGCFGQHLAYLRSNLQCSFLSSGEDKTTKILGRTE